MYVAHCLACAPEEGGILLQATLEAAASLLSHFSPNIVVKVMAIVMAIGQVSSESISTCQLKNLGHPLRERLRNTLSPGSGYRTLA